MTKRSKTAEAKPVRRTDMLRVLRMLMRERGFIDTAGNVDEAAIEAAETKVNA